MSIFSIVVIVSMLLILHCPDIDEIHRRDLFGQIVWRANIQKSFDYWGVSDREI